MGILWFLVRLVWALGGLEIFCKGLAMTTSHCSYWGYEVWLGSQLFESCTDWFSRRQFLGATFVDRYVLGDLLL